MEFKVKEVNPVEEKSVQEVEEQLLNGSFLPNLDNVFNLGSGTKRWKDANFAGSVSVGTLSDGTLSISSGTITGASLSADQISSGALNIGANELTINNIEVIGNDGEVNDAAIESSLTRDSELNNATIVRSNNITGWDTDASNDLTTSTGWTHPMQARM